MQKYKDKYSKQYRCIVVVLPYSPLFWSFVSLLQLCRLASLSTIVQFFSDNHDISMSVRTLHWQLADLALALKCQNAQLLAVWNTLCTELCGPF